ncbi:hypothetical protein CDAR_48961 [Caerostris darwini]|uniref:Uncharacterized protein n=1 Tax=Caerostris darwini TaxID=1538125 RepID=A0AAV4NHQ1_9ARAC|nr:hypothetical protein CDAR_48961 [Caerostris darwini]
MGVEVGWRSGNGSHLGFWERFSIEFPYCVDSLTGGGGGGAALTARGEKLENHWVSVSLSLQGEGDGPVLVFSSDHPSGVPPFPLDAHLGTSI